MKKRHGCQGRIQFRCVSASWLEEADRIDIAELLPAEPAKEWAFLHPILEEGYRPLSGFASQG